MSDVFFLNLNLNSILPVLLGQWGKNTYNLILQSIAVERVLKVLNTPQPIPAIIYIAVKTNLKKYFFQAKEMFEKFIVQPKDMRCTSVAHDIKKVVNFFAERSLKLASDPFLLTSLSSGFR